jgi:hypothetical protein
MKTILPGLLPLLGSALIVTAGDGESAREILSREGMPPTDSPGMNRQTSPLPAKARLISPPSTPAAQQEERGPP